VERLSALGKTILLTTHYMDEAQQLADRVAVVASGRLVALGPPAALVGQVEGGGTVISFELPPGVAAADLPRLGDELRVEGTTVTIRTARPVADMQALTAWALERDAELPSLQLLRPTLEEAYLELTEQPQDAGPRERGDA
jgi:ABC-2 type transport system ATP-binding protein